MFEAEVPEGRTIHQHWLAWRVAAVEQLSRLRACGWTYVVLPMTVMIAGWLLGLDMAFRYAVLDGSELPNWFNLSQERGLGELFEYAMTGLGALALAMLAWRKRSAGLAIVALVMALVTADNSLQVHESIGELGAGHLPTIGPIEGAALGELLFMASLGLICLAGLARCLMSAPTPALTGGLGVIVLVMAGAFFGVAIDAIHAAASTGTMFEVIIAGTEDGGEMICFALAGALAILVQLADRSTHGAPESP